ncbi:MAG: RNA methyltransferase [Acidobacteriota bacterium]|jgi:TrmH family RNA methyltransferase|nr:RNA methyltransferase [Acidobacteriota bacterium]
MTFKQLTARDNPLLKTIRKVTRHPETDDRMVVEGVRVLEELMAALERSSSADLEIEAVVVSEGFGSEPKSPRESRLIDSWQTRHVRLHQVSEDLFASISGVRTPQGAVALVRAAHPSLHQLRLGDNPLLLCALEIQDPGNLGTLIRTAAAAGATAVLTTQGTVSARNPKALRASAGAFFHIPVIENLRTEELISYCAEREIRMYQTDALSGVAHTQANLAAPCAVMLGNEGSGIDAAMFSGIPAIHIPMASGTESLNVATAGAVILFEASRQR